MERVIQSHHYCTTNRSENPHNYPAVSHPCRGLGGLVVSSRPRGRRVPIAKPDSAKEPACKWVWCTLDPSGLLVWCGSLERGCELRCGSRHLTMAQNCEFRSKIALVLLQNETLI
ncbi:hypothetical protein AVEN_175894-1 [Araneus ventricosus]|uniref:Uncharacterized protein n=1 Tax=Araneus ventricosus TaxID=182803 RepID=A0A4Y2ECU8_ARAVE|nr:hypothetical protein AVEN_175894-1 [Araneus ventricosus]